MKSNRRSNLTRRELLGAASAATFGAAFLPAPARASGRTSQLDQNYQVGKDPGKHEPLANFKFDIESSEGWFGEAGSAKEANVEEFPVSQSMAGVSMRLKPGGVRELHWHAIAAEWALVLEGTIRATVIAPNGESATDVFEPGDIWYFPKGHGHSLQNISNKDSHFVLGFDDGHFSEFGTFSITDWMARTPPEIVVKNLGLSLETVGNLPQKEAYIIPGKIASTPFEPNLAGDLETPQSAHKFRLSNATPLVFPCGWERIVTQREFPINTTLTSVLQHIDVGGLRELHWHPNADEWQYYIKGHARVTVFGAHGRAKTEEFEPGSIGFIPQGFGHYVEQVGTEPMEFFALFNSPTFEEISISKWLAGNPASLIADNFLLSKEDVAKLPRKTLGIVK